MLREAVSKGVREDQESPPRPLARTPSRAESSRGRIAVPRENILQLLPEPVPPSKEELAAYWTKVGSGRLRISGAGRSSSSVTSEARPSITRAGCRLSPRQFTGYDRKAEGGEGTRLWVDDLVGLLGLVEIGAVELHPWNASIDDIEHPDMLVFDLDPGEGVAWDFVIETALRLRRMLQDEGLEPWPKLTGGKGLHLMAPLEPNDRPRPGASLRQADRPAPRRNRTGAVHARLSARKARRAHLHRLPAERPRHRLRPRCAGARSRTGSVPTPFLSRSCRAHEMASGGPTTHERPPSLQAHPLKSRRPYNMGCPPVTGTTAPEM